jgi:hypothetical protein
LGYFHCYDQAQSSDKKAFPEKSGFSTKVDIKKFKENAVPKRDT